MQYPSNLLLPRSAGCLHPRRTLRDREPAPCTLTAASRSQYRNSGTWSGEPPNDLNRGQLVDLPLCVRPRLPTTSDFGLFTQSPASAPSRFPVATATAANLGLKSKLQKGTGGVCLRQFRPRIDAPAFLGKIWLSLEEWPVALKRDSGHDFGTRVVRGVFLASPVIANDNKMLRALVKGASSLVIAGASDGAAPLGVAFKNDSKWRRRFGGMLRAWGKYFVDCREHCPWIQELSTWTAGVPECRKDVSGGQFVKEWASG
jgi:hypothetical protein